MHVGLVLINSQIGGTEKRFANLFNRLTTSSQCRYSLLLPVGLAHLLRGQGILRSGQREIVEIFVEPPYSLYNRLPPIWRGVTVRGLTRMLGPLWRRNLSTEALQRLFDSFDVIHYALPTSYLLGALPFDRPVVVEAQDANLTALSMPFMEEAYRQGAFFNFHSRRIREEYEHRTGRRSDRFFVAPCSFGDYRQLSAGSKERIVAFVGRLETIKNPLLFVDAVAQVARRRRDFTAYVLGAGTLERKVRQRIASLGIGDITVCRYHPCPQEVLSRALVFVSLQPSDNYGSQALIEAMACGCAIVASDVGQTREMIPPGAGALVPLAVDPLAEQISSLLDGGQRTAAMGSAARDWVIREHNVERYRDYLENLYDQAYRAPTGPSST